MRKFILCLIFCIASYGISQAQNLSKYISEIANSENIQHQTIDRATLEASIEAAKAIDPSGKLSEQIPSFMLKLDTIDIMDLTPCLPDIKAEFMARFDSLTESDEYELLLTADEDNDRVKILSKAEGAITKELVILAVDTLEDEIVILKLTGNLESADVEKIISEPSQITGKQ